MKKFLLLGVMFLCFGELISAKKVNLSFSTADYCAAHWDASTNTLTWGSGGWNSAWTFMTADGISGDITNYTKLHLKLTNFTNASAGKVTVVFKENDGSNPPSGPTTEFELTPDNSGIAELDLTTVVWKCDITKLQDLTIYGCSRDDTSVDASVKVTEAYLEEPDPDTREVYSLGTPITFEDALASSDPFVVVSNGQVLCGPLSPSDGALTFKDVSEIGNYSWKIQFEEDADNAGSYYMNLIDSKGNSKGYVNGSIWSHTYLSNVNKEGTKGEVQDGALWTVSALGNNKYSIRNLGVAEGNYNNKPNADGGDRTSQGYLAPIPDGYWANHVTFYNTSCEWQFYTLSTTILPANDAYYFGWDDLTFDGDAAVTVDEESHLVLDGRGYAPYWTKTAKWNLSEPFDATNYRYLVFYAKRNVTHYGKDGDTGGTVFITDGNDITFRGDDYAIYNEVSYPAHTGKMWMNIWNEQRATVIDLQWLANTDKYGDGSECKVLDITKIKDFGFSGDFVIGGAFFTNTQPNYSAGDYKRGFDTFDKFGTICLPYNAVCCGADIYEIVKASASGVTLAVHDGIMEAGKAYLYKTLEAKKRDGSTVDETNVYFFKAGYEQVDAPVANNGLIGTFSEIKAPASADNYVLSGNKLYDLAGATDENAVTVGANKAYIDKTQIVDKSAESKVRTVVVEFENSEASEIQTVEDVKNVLNGQFYDLNGRPVSHPTRGLYIVNGMKVLMK